MRAQLLVVAAVASSCVLQLLPVITAEAPSTSNVTLDRRDPRLFSNPFGILGHADCTSKLQPGNRDVSGSCYNEVECIMRGGRLGRYCGPPAVTGVCCIFITDKCEGVTINERVAYFTNPSYPFTDSTPFACFLKIRPVDDDTCWVRFDLEDFELASNENSDCNLDSVSVLNSAGGEGGRICGRKSGYSIVARAAAIEKDLGLSVMVQSNSYKWNIKITQIKCTKVQPLPSFDSCGNSPVEENSALISNALRNLDLSSMVLVEKKLTKKHGRKVFKLKRRKKSPAKSVVSEVCNVDSDACKLVQMATSSSHDQISRRSDRDDRAGGKETKGPHPLTRRRLLTERYFPAFSTRDVFCRSKFRNPTPATFKIIDGVEATVNTYPWIVSMQFKNQHFCGGSLLNERYVITAAHCMEFGNIKNFLDDLTIHIGDHDLVNTDETVAVTRKVVRVINYWRFQNLPGTPGDISILRLDSPVEFGSTIGPVCLPEDAEQTYERMVGIAAGWGITETGISSDVLREVELNIVPNRTCVDNLSAVAVKVTADMICTFKGPVGTESICAGDSGGPLMVRMGGRQVSVTGCGPDVRVFYICQGGSFKFILVGLSSFSVTDCAAPFPAVFSRVTFFLDWIAAAISSDL